MTAPLDRLAPTLAAYGPLDCGLLRIGNRWLVFVDDRVYDEQTYPSRVDAVDALYRIALDDERRRGQDIRQAELRG